MAEWQRTHTCGELRDTHIGQTVVINGWVNTFRSYNDQVFVDLRDRYGADSSSPRSRRCGNWLPSVRSLAANSSCPRAET